MHTCMHTCIHTYVHTCVRTYIHTHAHEHTYAYINFCTHTHTHTHTQERRPGATTSICCLCLVWVMMWHMMWWCDVMMWCTHSRLARSVVCPSLEYVLNTWWRDTRTDDVTHTQCDRQKARGRWCDKTHIHEMMWHSTYDDVTPWVLPPFPPAFQGFVRI